MTTTTNNEIRIIKDLEAKRAGLDKGIEGLGLVE